MPIVLVLLCAVATPALGQMTAAINIDTTITTPVQPGFSGVSADLGLPVEYWDYNFNTLAATMGFGWVRFPGGTSSDIYDWRIGQDNTTWQLEFPAGSAVAADTKTPELVAGRGGARLIDAANRANFLGASLIICVNGYTDTAISAGELAAYVKANQIHVAAWELSNEPYLYPSFFANATVYLNRMKPYRDAIKAVDPKAIIAVFATDQGSPGAATNSWDIALAAYTDKYWDAITYHHYPPQSIGPFAQWMADESAVLAGGTTAVITSRLASVGPSGVKFLNTEFDSSRPNDSAGNSSITDGTVWGGIYAAEYIMRLSTEPSVLYVGPSEIAYNAGVFYTTGHQSQVEAAAAANMPIDTATLNFGFYVSAQGLGTAVLNSVLKQAVAVNQTAVSGGASVPATGLAPIPALYAMSYTNAQGGLSVVITNKSAIAHQVTLNVNGAPAGGPFALQFISAIDPSAANTDTSPNMIAIQTASSGNPVPVPPYSVVRADITVPPVASFVNAASLQPGPLAAQQLVSASGAGFASQTITAPGPTLPLVLGDTSIAITDSTGTVSAAELVSVSPNGALFVIPKGVAQGAATVMVMRSGTTVLTGTLDIAAVSPGLYSANGNGAGVAAAGAVRYNALWMNPQPLTVFSCQASIALSCLSSPLTLGDRTESVVLFLYGTGIRGTGTVQAYVAGESLPVLYAGPQDQYTGPFVSPYAGPAGMGAGLDEVVVLLPRRLAGTGEASVYLTERGKASNMTTVNIQ